MPWYVAVLIAVVAASWATLEALEDRAGKD
jgi:hypothetical protein